MSDINIHMTFEDDDESSSSENTLNILDLHGVTKGKKLNNLILRLLKISLMRLRTIFII